MMLEIPGSIDLSLIIFMNSSLFNQIVEPKVLARPSTEVAIDLLGCTLVRKLPDGQILRGMIVETEAYAPGDPAFHAYRRVTPRNQVLFGSAGRTYIYLIYGIYHCLNIVTDLDGVPSAVLIRALQLERLPVGVDSAKIQRIAAGPGKLCRVLQIDRSLNGIALQQGEALWLEHRQPEFQQQLDNQAITIVQTTRIGLSQGIDLPWRWYLHPNPAVSQL